MRPAPEVDFRQKFSFIWELHCKVGLVSQLWLTHTSRILFRLVPSSLLWVVNITELAAVVLLFAWFPLWSLYIVNTAVSCFLLSLYYRLSRVLSSHFQVPLGHSPLWLYIVESIFVTPCFVVHCEVHFGLISIHSSLISKSFAAFSRLIVNIEVLFGGIFSTFIVSSVTPVVHFGRISRPIVINGDCPYWPYYCLFTNSANRPIWSFLPICYCQSFNLATIVWLFADYGIDTIWS